MSEKEEPVVAYKGFDKNFQCRGFQYEVGKTYIHTGKLEVCEAGFHACANPLDVLDYYPLSTETRFAIVRASGEIQRQNNKLASAIIEIEAELRFPEFVGAAISFVQGLCNFTSKPENVASGDDSQLAASGDNSIAVSVALGCRAKAGQGGCIALRWTKDDRPRMAVAYVGENGIKPDVWYSLDTNGKFVEVEA